METGSPAANAELEDGYGAPNVAIRIHMKLAVCEYV